MSNPLVGSPPCIAVIVPCYNVEGLITDAVESVQMQTHQSWSLILVDDGSTDSTLKVLTDIASELGPRVTVLSHQNRGACHARNRGVAASKAEFLAFLDADDQWHPEKLRLQVDFLSLRPDVVGVTSGYKMIDPGSARSSDELEFRWSRREILNWTLLGRRAPALNSTLLVRRQPFLLAGGYDEALGSYADDLDLAWRLTTIGPVESLPQSLVTLRISESQAHRDYPRMATSLKQVYAKLAASEPRLSKKASQNLALYLEMRTAFELPGRVNWGRVGLRTLAAPLTTFLFLTRKLKDQGRLRLRRDRKKSN